MATQTKRSRIVYWATAYIDGAYPVWPICESATGGTRFNGQPEGTYVTHEEALTRCANLNAFIASIRATA